MSNSRASWLDKISSPYTRKLTLHVANGIRCTVLG